MSLLTSTLALLISTGCGSGLLRPAPGTIGSLAALFFWISFIAPTTVPLQILAIVSLTIAGVFATSHMLRLPHPWLGNSRKAGDPASIVVDEWVGMWLAVVGHPPADYLLCFVLFRVFDALKPYPVRVAERIPGSIGVMADDLLAGILASATVVTIRVACAS